MKSSLFAREEMATTIWWEEAKHILCGRTPSYWMLGLVYGVSIGTVEVTPVARNNLAALGI